MTSTLYTNAILRLASSLTDEPRLSDPDGSAELRSPTCGSRIITDVRMTDGRVSAFSQHVRACALGQASAAIVGAQLEGQSVDAVSAAAGELRAFLSGARDDPGAWPGVDVFMPARDYPARHAAILLPFDAAVAAMRAT